MAGELHVEKVEAKSQSPFGSFRSSPQRPQQRKSLPNPRVSIAFRLVPVFAEQTMTKKAARRKARSQSPFGSFRSSPESDDDVGSDLHRSVSIAFRLVPVFAVDLLHRGLRLRGLSLNRLSARSGLRRSRSRCCSTWMLPSQSPFGSFRSSPKSTGSRKTSGPLLRSQSPFGSFRSSPAS